MLDWIFIMILITAILLTLLSIISDGYGTFWDISIIALAILLWFLLAASIQEIEIPWQMYNATSGNIETGYHTFSSPISPFLVYLFIAFAIVNIVYFVGYVFGPTIVKKLRGIR